ncbi:GIY-YIG nuclease family protein [Nocardia sp. NPDC059764]|uniref:GIY-YIG nuclease family protein n=1 Tax=Nocardia sp. NPDC059764 TaxID=3346939 RepID=UPI0036510A63
MIAKNGIIEVGDLYGPQFSQVAPNGPEGLFSDADVDTMAAVIKHIRATADPETAPVARKGDELLGYPVGFVYVLSNPAMPGLVKIGRADRLITTRAGELQSTGVPLPFEVEHGLMTSHPGDVEKKAQDSLAPFRVAPNREFFRVPVPQAILAVQEAAEDAAGIGRWAGSCHRISCGERLALSMREGQLLIVMHYPDHPFRPSMTTISPRSIAFSILILSSPGDASILARPISRPILLL